MCATCPFSGTEAAEVPINLGCVPCPFEIVELKRNHNLNWGCHSKPTEVCKGFIAQCKLEGLNPAEGAVLPYEEWYYNGAPT